jgi:hypothetical protein
MGDQWKHVGKNPKRRSITNAALHLIECNNLAQREVDLVRRLVRARG